MLPMLGGALKVVGKVFFWFGIIYSAFKGVLSALDVLGSGGSIKDAIIAFFSEFIKFFTFGILDGKALMSILYDFGKLAFDFVMKWAMRVFDFFRDKVIPKLKKFWNALTDWTRLHLFPLFAAIWNFTKKKIIPLLFTMFQKISEWATQASTWIMSIIADYLPWISQLMTDGKVHIEALIGGLTNLFNWMAEASWKDIFDLVKIGAAIAVRKTLDILADVIVKIFSTIVKGVWAVHEWIANSIKNIIKGIVAASGLPSFVTGGINKAVDAVFGAVDNNREEKLQTTLGKMDNWKQDFYGGNESAATSLLQSMGVEVKEGEKFDDVISRKRMEMVEVLRNSAPQTSGPSPFDMIRNVMINNNSNASSASPVIPPKPPIIIGPNHAHQTESTFSTWGRLMRGDPMAR